MANLLFPILYSSGHLDAIRITAPVTICNATIGEVISTSDLVLINCDVQKVAARHLWLIDCVWQRAWAEGNAWIQPKADADGTARYNPIRVDGVPIYVCASSARDILFRNCKLTQKLVCPAEWEIVIFHDCEILGGVTFPGSHHPSTRAVGIAGNTFLKGGIIGATLTDERKT